MHARLKAMLLGLLLLAALGATGDARAAAAPLAPDPTEVWVQAGAALKAGDAALAAERYRSLLDAGVVSGELYYNLGNALLRSGKLGAAIAAYRQSQRELPRDQDVRTNLAFARHQAKDAVAPPEPSAALETLFFWHYGLSRHELLVSAAAVNLLFWLLLALTRRHASEGLRWASLALGCLLACVVGSFATRTLAPRRLAVVQSEEAAVHAGIGADSLVRFRLHEGAEATVLASESGWIRIALSDGNQGWLAASDVAVLEL
jgi:tetratricopeptide (TPR) repeat protein